MRSGSTSGRARRNETAARRSASLPCGSSWRRGWPCDSPKFRWSNASVTYPAAARRPAYRPVTWSRTPVNGPVNTRPGARSPAGGARRSPTSVMPSASNSTRSIALLQSLRTLATRPGTWDSVPPPAILATGSRGVGYYPASGCQPGRSEPESGLQAGIAGGGRQPGEAEQVLGGAEQAQVVEVVARGGAGGGVGGHHDRGDVAGGVGSGVGVGGVPAGFAVHLVGAGALVPGD